MRHDTSTDSAGAAGSSFSVHAVQLDTSVRIDRLMKGSLGGLGPIGCQARGSFRFFSHLLYLTTSGPLGTGAGVSRIRFNDKTGFVAGFEAVSTVPGIGPFIGAGVLAATLGGAVVGAGVGAIAGALIGMGLPEHEARYYEGEARKGRTLLAVGGGRNEEADRIMHNHGGYDTQHPAVEDDHSGQVGANCLTKFGRLRLGWNRQFSAKICRSVTCCGAVRCS